MDTNKQYYFLVSEDLRTRIGRHQNARDNGTWKGGFKIMTWLYSAINVTGEFILELHYRDDRGEHIVAIDRCTTTNGSQILLSSQTSLTISGTLSFAKLRVSVNATPQKNLSVLEYGFLPTKLKQQTQKTA